MRPGGDLCVAAKVRNVDMAWVTTLMSKMQNCPWVAGMLPMLVVIDPDQCPRVDAFEIDKFDKGEYDLYVLGGNHSFIAQQRLRTQFHGVDAYKWMEATVLAGMSQEEMRLVATDHNLMAECRKTFTFSDKVRYIRHEYLDREISVPKKSTGIDWKLDVADRLGMLAAWDVSKNGDEVKFHRLLDNNTLEFCVAKVSPEVWVYVDEIFEKFEKKRLPEQIAAAAALEAKQAKMKRKSRKSSAIKDNLVVEKKERGIPVRVWRGFQGIDQSAAGDLSLKTACMKVLSGDLTLSAMHTWLEKAKKLHLIHVALYKHLNCANIEEACECYPGFTTVEQISSFQLAFGGVRVRSVGNLAVLPASFQEHIAKAKAWKKMTLQQQELAKRGGAAKFTYYSSNDWPQGVVSKLSVITGDMRKISEFLEPRAYTLLVMDLPRELELEPISAHFDKRFCRSELESIISQFATITTTDVFRFVIFHSPDDMVVVRSVLMAACKGPVHTCVWQKTNIVCPEKEKLYDAVDFITVAAGTHLSCVPSTFPLGASFYGSGGAAGFTNVFREPVVELKLCYSTAEDKVVSPYQKPLRLMKRLISMFSMQGDWIVDGCAGSGSGMVAGAQLARNVVAVDVDTRCTQYIDLRINSLEQLPTETEEIGEANSSYGLKVWRKEPMVNVVDGGRGSLITLRSACTNTCQNTVNHGFNAQVPGQQLLPQMLKAATTSGLNEGATEAATMNPTTAVTGGEDFANVDVVPDSVGPDEPAVESLAMDDPSSLLIPDGGGGAVNVDGCEAT